MEKKKTSDTKLLHQTRQLKKTCPRVNSVRFTFGNMISILEIINPKSALFNQSSGFSEQ